MGLITGLPEVSKLSALVAAKLSDVMQPPFAIDFNRELKPVQSATNCVGMLSTPPIRVAGVPTPVVVTEVIGVIGWLGILRTLPVSVAAPLVPFVVKVIWGVGAGRARITGDPAASRAITVDAVIESEGRQPPLAVPLSLASRSAHAIGEAAGVGGGPNAGVPEASNPSTDCKGVVVVGKHPFAVEVGRILDSNPEQSGMNWVPVPPVPPVPATTGRTIGLPAESNARTEVAVTESEGRHPPTAELRSLSIKSAQIIRLGTVTVEATPLTVEVSTCPAGELEPSERTLVVALPAGTGLIIGLPDPSIAITRVGETES